MNNQKFCDNNLCTVTRQISFMTFFQIKYENIFVFKERCEIATYELKEKNSM